MRGKSGLASGAVALAVLAAVVVYAVADSTAVTTTCYLGVLIGASVGAWIGAERAPRGRRLVPRLIAVGVTLTALGDVGWFALEAMSASNDVSIADPAWFASYVVLCAALWLVLLQSRRRGQGGRLDVDVLLDAVTIVVVSVLVFWSVAIDPIVEDRSLSPFVRVVWAAYPVADAVLLALVVRVLMSARTRAAIGPSFAVGVCLWLGADIAYTQAPEGDAQLVMDAAWMIGPVLLARAAWRHTDIRADVSGAHSPPGVVPQIILAVGPLLVPPTLELITDLSGAPDHPGRLLIGTVVLIALAVVRTGRLIRAEQCARRELVVARDAALAGSRAALEASRTKSMFLANMSHEIRTPLTTVLATAEMLEDTRLDDAQLMLLAKMGRSGQLLNSLVEGILDFSRIEAGELKLASTSFDLHALVVEAADVHAPRAISAGIRLERGLDPRLPQTVVGDSGRLFQVLTNLLDNALKFTPQGQVTLVARVANAVDVGEVDDGDNGGNLVEFIVADTGIGICEVDQGSVFDSFSQVDGSMTRHHGGTGLGLAICKELTELMGGTITVQSHLGVGSTFVVRIPVVRTQRSHTAPGLSLLPLVGDVPETSAGDRIRAHGTAPAGAGHHSA